MHATTRVLPPFVPLARATGATLAAAVALRNLRELGLMAATLSLGLLFFGMADLFIARIHVGAGVAFAALGAALLFYGSHAVGLMAMDEAQGQRARPVADAVAASLASGHRLMGALLVFAVLTVALVGGLALALVACRLPVVGPLLFVVVLPLVMALAGVLVLGFLAVVFPLTAPAMWAGAGMVEAVASVLAVARQRACDLIAMMLLLLVLVGVLAAVAATVAVAGAWVAGSLVAGLLGQPLQPGAVLSNLQAGILNGDAYRLGAALGASLLFAAAASVPALAFTRGCCAVHVACARGVDTAPVDRQLRRWLRGAAPPLEEGAKPPVQLHCPVCAAPADPGDRFCRTCGTAREALPAQRDPS